MSELSLNRESYAPASEQEVANALHEVQQFCEYWRSHNKYIYLEPDSCPSAPVLLDAYSRVEKGELGGRLGLRIYDYVWRHTRDNQYKHLYYHGTPLSRDQLHNGALSPHQPFRKDYTGRSFTHGPRGICVSDTIDEPTILALFHRNAPAMQLLQETASRTSQKHFAVRRHATPAAVSIYPADLDTWVAHHITTEAVMEFITQYGGAGFVHTIISESMSTPLFVRNGEYRFPASIKPTHSIAVTAEDLPGDLLIVDGSVKEVEVLQDAWNRLENLFAAMNETGVTVRTLQGYWPEQMYQPPDRIN